MPIKAELDYKWGQALYLRNDPEQAEYLLNKIILEPKKITLELFTPACEFIEVPENFVTKEKDTSKTLGIDKKERDEEES